MTSAGDARPASRTPAASAGTSTRRFSVEPRRAAADRIVRSHRASPARRSGSIRRRRCSSSSCRTACTPTARATSRRCARGSRRSPPSAVIEPADARPRSRRLDRARLRRRRARWRRGRTLPVVLSGIDVLRAEGFAPLRGKRVGLVTNHTGRARDGATTIDLLFGAKDVKLVALFSPEHGIRGIARRQGRLDEGREDRADDSLALRRDAASDGRDARRARRHRHRSAGHRRALLHLHDDDGLRAWRRPRSAACRSSCSIVPTRSTASRSRGRRSTRRSSASPATSRRCRSGTA